MIFAPFCLFPEEMFLRAAIAAITLIVLLMTGIIWYALKITQDWFSTKEILRMRQKEDSLREMEAARVWHETR